MRVHNGAPGLVRVLNSNPRPHVWFDERAPTVTRMTPTLLNLSARARKALTLGLTLGVLTGGALIAPLSSSAATTGCGTVRIGDTGLNAQSTTQIGKKVSGSSVHYVVTTSTIVYNYTRYPRVVVISATAGDTNTAGTYTATATKYLPAAVGAYAGGSHQWVTAARVVAYRPGTAIGKGVASVPGARALTSCTHTHS